MRLQSAYARTCRARESWEGGKYKTETECYFLKVEVYVILKYSVTHDKGVGNNWVLFHTYNVHDKNSIRTKAKVVLCKTRTMVRLGARL